jgi:hypothetical protein
VIRGAAFCPHPPVLIPHLAAGAAPELEPLRSACIESISAVAATGAQLVLLGSAGTTRAHSPLARGTMAGFGVPLEVHLGSPSCGGAVELPLSLTVGAWLVREALGPRTGTRGFSVGPDFASSRIAAELLQVLQDEPVALVVMGDGSARRTTTSPGYVDERAVPFDDEVARALAAGDAAALEALDPDLGAQLLAAGVPAWRAAGRMLEGEHFDAQVTYYDDPYGVAYLVATWLRRG